MLWQTISFLETYFQAHELPKNQCEGMIIYRQPMIAPIEYLRRHVERGPNVLSTQIIANIILLALLQFIGESKTKQLGMMSFVSPMISGFKYLNEMLRAVALALIVLV